MAGVKTYNPFQVQIVIGDIIVTGYADGTFVTVSQDETRFVKSTGADGEVSRTKTNNRSATVTLTLKQTSSTNDLLSELARLDDESNAGVRAFTLKESGSGGTIIFAQTAWIENLPDIVYSKDEENREWTIALADASTFVGGNTGANG
jgi:hypothetical protein